jgi:hypothetical protein
MFGRERKFERDGARDREGGVATAEHSAEHPADTREPRRRGTEDGATITREGRMRQRDEFGGFNWGAAFFGWLVAVGMAVLLTAIVSAAGAAIGLTQGANANDADTIGIVGGILLLAVTMLAYYAGGYVAGRMSRFDGARQGLGVWVFGLLVTIALAIAGAVLGNEYNVLEQLDLPRIPVSPSELTTGGVIALVAIVVGTLIAAIAGGKVGERYHRKVDRAGLEA